MAQRARLLFVEGESFSTFRSRAYFHSGTLVNLTWAKQLARWSGWWYIASVRLKFFVDFHLQEILTPIARVLIPATRSLLPTYFSDTNLLRCWKSKLSFLTETGFDLDRCDWARGTQILHWGLHSPQITPISVWEPFRQNRCQLYMHFVEGCILGMMSCVPRSPSKKIVHTTAPRSYRRSLVRSGETPRCPSLIAG